MCGPSSQTHPVAPWAWAHVFQRCLAASDITICGHSCSQNCHHQVRNVRLHMEPLHGHCQARHRHTVRQGIVTPAQPSPRWDKRFIWMLFWYIWFHLSHMKWKWRWNNELMTMKQECISKQKFTTPCYRLLKNVRCTILLQFWVCHVMLLWGCTAINCVAI